MLTISECILAAVFVTGGWSLDLGRSDAPDAGKMLARVRQELLAMEGPEPSVVKAVERLLVLGKGSERALLEVLEAGTITGSDQQERPLTSRQEEALLHALAAQPADLVRRMVTDRAASATETRTRVALIKVLGCMGSRLDVPLLFRIASAVEIGPAVETAEGEPAELPVAAEVLEHAFSAILGRDPRAFSGLEGRLRAADPRLFLHLVRGIGASRRSEGILVLGSMLGESDATDAAVLEEIARLARVNQPPFDPYAIERVRSYFDSQDPEIRRAAVEAAGWLADDESASRLIEMLETDTRIVRGSALEALRTLSGYSYPADPERWRAWLRTEQEWWDDRADGVFGGLDSRDLSIVVASLGEICSKRFRRQDLAERLVPLLLDGDPVVRKLACQALVQLGTLAALPALIDRLDDAEPSVRDAAWGGLKLITKLDLPPEPEPWRQALADQTISRSPQ